MTDFDRVVFFGRTLEEYQKMFDLKCCALQSVAILDCPGGPSSFQSTSREMYGIRTVSVDPMYAHTFEELECIGKEDIEITVGKVRGAPEKFPLITDLSAYHARRCESLNNFLEDFKERSGDTYISASLPSLPFANESFDIVISGYLLFIYSSCEFGGIMKSGESDIFDMNWHIASIKELLRVARKQIKLFPAYTYGGVDIQIHPFAQEIVKVITAEMPDVDCSFYRPNLSGTDHENEVGLCLTKKSSLDR